MRKYFQAHVWRISACMIWNIEMTIHIRFQNPAPWRIFLRSMVKLVKTMLKNTKPTRSRKTKSTRSTYHVTWDSLCEVQSSTTLKKWDSFTCEHKSMRFPLSNDKCMTYLPSREWITSLPKATSFMLDLLSHIPPLSFFFCCCGACFSFSHPTFFILLAISCSF